MATASLTDLDGAYKKVDQKYFGLTDIIIKNDEVISLLGLVANGSNGTRLPANKSRFCGLLEMVADGENFTAADGSNLGAASSIMINAPKGLQQRPDSYTSTSLPKTVAAKSALIERLILLANDTAPGNKQDRLKIKFKTGIPLTLTKMEKVPKLGGQVSTPGSVSSPLTEQQEKVTRSIFEILLTTNGYNPPTGDTPGGFNPDSNTTAGAKDAKTLADFNLFCQGLQPKGYRGRKINLSNDWPSIATIAAAGVDIQKKKGGSFVVTLNATKDNTIKAWYWTFFVQFKNIKNDPKLANDTYTIFNRDGGFMDFITDIITAGPRDIDTQNKSLSVNVSHRTQDWPHFRKVNKKDSWNPADIWLIKNQPATRYHQFIRDIKNARTVNKLNSIMINAFKEKTIVGISLKKPSVTAGGKGNIEYDLVNMTKHVHKDLPAVMYDDWPMVLNWHNTRGIFDPTSNALFLKYEGIQVARLDLGSSATGVGNLKIEFQEIAETGSAAAKLGRVPRPGLLRLLELWGLTVTDVIVVKGKQSQGTKHKSGLDIPEWEEVQDSLPFTTKGIKNGAFPGKNRMVSNGKVVADTPAEIKEKTTNWQKKFDYVNSTSGNQIISGGVTKLTTRLLNQIINARNSSTFKSGGLSQKSICIQLQIINFAYMLVSVYNKHHDKSLHKTKIESFSMFMRSLYYFAQKKGGYFGTQFGPFGKLH